MIICLKDVNGNIVELRSEDFANMLEQLLMEYTEENLKIKEFIEWIKYGCDD